MQTGRREPSPAIRRLQYTQNVYLLIFFCIKQGTLSKNGEHCWKSKSNTLVSPYVSLASSVDGDPELIAASQTIKCQVSRTTEPPIQ